MRSIIITFFILLTISASSQTVDFSVEPSNVCPGDLVTFTNKSTGTDGLNPYWFLGEGENSVEINANYKYETSGTHNITLQYKDDAGTVIAEKTIENAVTVMPRPEISITSSVTEGCRPLEVSFSYEVTNSTEELISFEWDYDDGTPSDVIANPTHIFNDDKNNEYFVTLYAVDKNGCDNGTTFDKKSLKIETVGKASSATFTTSSAKSCDEEQEVTFEITESDENITQFIWDFGDGATTTTPEKTVTHVYKGFDEYTPSLTVVNEECTSSPIKGTTQIELQEYKPRILLKDEVKAGFINTDAQLPCPGKLSFYGQAPSINQQSNSYEWEINGSTVSSNQVYTGIHSSGENLEVILTATNEECTAYDTLNIQVEPENPILVPTPELLCNTSSVSLNAETVVPSTDFVWEVIKEGVAGEPVLLEGSPATFFTEMSGEYIGSVIAISENHCPTSGTFSFEKVSFISGLDVDKTEGCAPFETTFDLHSSFTPPGSDYIKSIEWDFGTEQRSSLDSIQKYTYETDGKFEATVLVTTAKGCSKHYSKIITPGKELPYYYEILIDTVCGGETMNLEFKSDSMHLLTNGYVGFTSTNGLLADDETSVVYKTLEPNERLEPYVAPMMNIDTGSFSVYTTMGYHGCNANYDPPTEVTSSPYVFGPVADYKVIPRVCDERYTVDCNVDFIKDAETWSWDFGDINGGTFQDTTPPTYTYRAAKKYEVNFLAVTEHETWKTCTLKSGRSVEIKNITTEYDIQNYACVSETITPIVANITDSVEIDSALRSLHFFWYSQKRGSSIIDSLPRPLSNRQLEISFPEKGIYDTWIATSPRDTCGKKLNKIPIKVYQPEAKFAWDTLSLCPQLEAELRDITETDTAIVDWKYTITLLTYRDDSIFNKTEYTETQDLPVLTIEDNMQASIILEVENKIGCRDTTDTISSSILSTHKINTTIYNDTAVCKGTEVQFIRERADIDSVIWLMDDADNTSYSINDEDDFSVYHTYQDTGRYYPTLVLIDSVQFTYKDEIRTSNCIDSATMIVDIRDLKANLVLDKTMLFCKSEVNIIDSSASEYYTGYEFYQELPNGEMDLKNTKDPALYKKIPLEFDNRTSTPGTDYPYPANYDVVMKVTTDYKGCNPENDTAHTLYDTVQVHIGDYSFDIGSDKDEVCLREEVNFFLTSNSNIGDYPFFWYLDDGKASRDENTSYAYGIPSETKTIEFALDFGSNPKVDIDRAKCPEFTKTITLNIKQEYIKFSRGIGDSTIAGCGPYTVDFINESKNVSEFKWDFGDGTQSSEINPTHTFTDPGTVYKVKLESDDALNCKEADIKAVTVHPNPSVSISDEDIICFGNATNLEVSTSDATQHIYSWQPEDYTAVTPELDVISVSPEQSTQYFLTATNIFDCFAYDTTYVEVIPPVFYNGISDTAIIIYDTMSLSNTNIPSFIYQWEPPTSISCSDCGNPDFFGQEDQDYELYITDQLGCMDTTINISIIVHQKANIGLPKAFSPNSDGDNDNAFARGWGIKEFLSLQIYNRWGQLVYETDDILKGWDGTYNGKPQPTETYTWIVKALYFNDEEIQRKGYITLLR